MVILTIHDWVFLSDIGEDRVMQPRGGQVENFPSNPCYSLCITSESETHFKIQHGELVKHGTYYFLVLQISHLGTGGWSLNKTNTPPI